MLHFDVSLRECSGALPHAASDAVTAAAAFAAESASTSASASFALDDVQTRIPLASFSTDSRVSVSVSTSASPSASARAMSISSVMAGHVSARLAGRRESESLGVSGGGGGGGVAAGVGNAWGDTAHFVLSVSSEDHLLRYTHKESVVKTVPFRDVLHVARNVLFATRFTLSLKSGRAPLEHEVYSVKDRDALVHLLRQLVHHDGAGEPGYGYPEPAVLFSGRGRKQGALRKADRFLSLQMHRLMVFRTQASGFPLNAILLADSVVDEVPGKDGLRLRTLARTYEFYFGSSGERDDWLEQLTHAIGVASDRVVPMFDDDYLAVRRERIMRVASASGGAHLTTRRRHRRGKPKVVGRPAAGSVAPPPPEEVVGRPAADSIAPPPPPEGRPAADSIAPPPPPVEEMVKRPAAGSVAPAPPGVEEEEESGSGSDSDSDSDGPPPPPPPRPVEEVEEVEEAVQEEEAEEVQQEQTEEVQQEQAEEVQQEEEPPALPTLQRRRTYDVPVFFEGASTPFGFVDFDEEEAPTLSLASLRRRIEFDLKWRVPSAFDFVYHGQPVPLASESAFLLSLFPNGASVRGTFTAEELAQKAHVYGVAVEAKDELPVEDATEVTELVVEVVENVEEEREEEPEEEDEVTLTVQLADADSSVEPVALGFVEARRTAFLVDVREMIREELDDVPSEFVFLIESPGGVVPVGRRQEAKRKVAAVVKDNETMGVLTIRARQKKKAPTQAASLGPPPAARPRGSSDASIPLPGHTLSTGRPSAAPPPPSLLRASTAGPTLAVAPDISTTKVVVVAKSSSSPFFKKRRQRTVSKSGRPEQHSYSLQEQIERQKNSLRPVRALLDRPKPPPKSSGLISVLSQALRRRRADMMNAGDSTSSRLSLARRDSTDWSDSSDSDSDSDSD